MLGKMTSNFQPSSKPPRDGRHCDLCGSPHPAVRCDKCGRQTFCLSCDDMYHQHPKRRFHLRKAVDPIPPAAAAQARPVLPVKVSSLTGDPSKMPLPPPRRKKTSKSLFDSFRRRTPSRENSPPIPKKEQTWSDRLGTIKKFMSNRPLPPLPPEEEDIQANGHTTPRHNLAFIHQKVEERAPQLPSRTMKPQEFSPGRSNIENSRGAHGYVGDTRNGNHASSNQRGMSPWNNMPDRTPHMTSANGNMHFPFMPPGGYPGIMHQSASATDLHALPGLHNYPPQYPQYPVYPYPMYPPQYPGYQGQFMNLPPEGDSSDSDASSRHSKRHQFRKRAKRSQSVLMDKMGFQGQFYPYGPFPPGYGPGPWGPVPFEAPPSPSGSIRSLNRIGRNSRRRGKTTSGDDEEDQSASSSPLSRPKSSSSERPQPSNRKPVPMATTYSSSENDEDEWRANSKSSRKHSDPNKYSSPVSKRSPQSHKKQGTPKQKRDRTPSRHPTQGTQPPKDKPPCEEPSLDIATVQPILTSARIPSGDWQCVHCTFYNQAGSNICQVCCKTATLDSEEEPVAQNLEPTNTTVAHNAETKRAVPEIEKGEEKGSIKEENEKKEKKDMEVLNSALDAAEKEISRGLEELMKLKEDLPLESNTEVAPPSPQSKPKPVYKSSGKLRPPGSLNSRAPPSTSTSTDTQTTWTRERGVEPLRRPSTSSIASEEFNSPTAQSPQPETKDGGVRKDFSCQTYDVVTPRANPMTSEASVQQDADSLRRNDKELLGRSSFRYADRVASPLSLYDAGVGGYRGPMHRSHSRASLFTGRVNEPLEYSFAPGHMYRSVSRSSLAGDYGDVHFSDFRNMRKPDYYLSMEELVERRRQESMRAQGLELVRMIREAEQHGFTAEDIQVALHNCDTQSPLAWLRDNWRGLLDSVLALTARYADDKDEVGVLSEGEARDALRAHKGNVWAAVTECVEGRQRMFAELNSRGSFSRQSITDALSLTQGDVESAHAHLLKSKSQSSKPFLMRIWGAGEGAQNQDGSALPPLTSSTSTSVATRYQKLNDEEINLSDWEDEDVEWEESDEERGDLQTCREDLDVFVTDRVTSPESDYCDAFPGSRVNTLDRNVSMSNEVLAEERREKIKTNLLNKLKDAKAVEETVEEPIYDVPKPMSKLSMIKHKMSAIKDTVTGTFKGEKKFSISSPERRTIVVSGKLSQESLCDGDTGNVLLTAVTHLTEDTTSMDSLEDFEPDVPELERDISEGHLDIAGLQNDIQEISNAKQESDDKNETASPKDKTKGKSSLLAAVKAKAKVLNRNNDVSHIQSSVASMRVTDKAAVQVQTLTNNPLPSTSTGSNSNEGENSDFDAGTLKAAPSKIKIPSRTADEMEKENMPNKDREKKLRFLGQLDSSKTQRQKETSQNSETEGSTPLKLKQSLVNNIQIETNENHTVTAKKNENHKDNKSLREDLSSKKNLENISEVISYSNKNKDTSVPFIDDISEVDVSTDAKQEKNVKLLQDESHFTEVKESELLINSKNVPIAHSMSTKNEKRIDKNENKIKKYESSNFESKTEQIEGMGKITNLSTKHKSTTDIVESPIKSDTTGTKIETNNTLNSTRVEISAAKQKLTDEKSVKSSTEDKRLNLKQLDFKNTIQTDSDNKKCDKNKLHAESKVEQISTEERNQLSNDGKNIPSSEIKESKEISNKPIEFPPKHFKIYGSSSKKTIKTNKESEKCLKVTKPSTSKTIYSGEIDQTMSKPDVPESISPQNKERNLKVVSPISESSLSFESASEHLSVEDISAASSTSQVTYPTVSNSLNVSSEIGDSRESNSVPTETSREVIDVMTHQDKTGSMQMATVTQTVTEETVHPEHQTPELAEERHEFQETGSSGLDVPQSFTPPVSPDQNTENESHPSVLGIERALKGAVAGVNENRKESVEKDERVSNTFVSSAEKLKTISSDKENCKATVRSSINADCTKSSSPTLDASTDIFIPDGTSYTSPQSPKTSADGTSVVEDNNSMLMGNPHKLTNNLRNANSITDTPTDTKFFQKELTNPINDNSSTTFPILESSNISTNKNTPHLSSTKIITEDNHSPLSDNYASSQSKISASNNGTNVPPINQPIPTDINSGPSSPIASVALPNNQMSSTTTDDQNISSGSPSPIKSMPLPNNQKSITTTEDQEMSSGSSFHIDNVAPPNNQTSTTTSDVQNISSGSSSHINSVALPNNQTSIKTTEEQDLNLGSSSRNKTVVPLNNQMSIPTAEDQDLDSGSSDNDNSISPASPIEALRSRFEKSSVIGSIRPQSPMRRMSFRSIKSSVALERTRDSSTEKPWYTPKQVLEPVKAPPKRTLKQQMEMERKVRKLVSDRKCRTYKQAELVVQLQEMDFNEQEALQAAKECSSLEKALSFLRQECQLCANHFPVAQMVPMAGCAHSACRGCVRAYFTVQVRDRSVVEMGCPFCGAPHHLADPDDDDAHAYFNHLDIMLKKLVDEEIHELFQRKLRDRALMRDPNFRWCSQCSSGFLTDGNLTRLECPDCNAVTCATCRRLWERDHQGISCEEFAALKGQAEPAEGLAKLLIEDGIDCPRCHFRYQLAKGGCMHFRCIQCQHDFCSGCSRPFRMGQKCGTSEFCAKLGLHAHHPRNCLFYLRDKEPKQLQRLLQLSDVSFDVEPPEGVEVATSCRVPEQKETPEGMRDDPCGKDVEPEFAGLCRIHYVEYLGQLVNRHQLDPIQIFEKDDLELVLKRASIRLPPKRYRETDDEYRDKLIRLIQEELPLDKMDGS